MDKIDLLLKTYIEESAAQGQKTDLDLAAKVGAAGLAGAAMAAKAGKIGALGKLMVAAKAGSGLQVVDPSEPDRWEAAKYGAILSGLGTAAINAPAVAFGNLPVEGLGAISAIASGKGAALSAALAGGRDTLLKSSVLPAAFVAASSAPTNYLLDKFGVEAHVDPLMGAAITGLVNTGLWAHRNWNNKNKRYI